MQKLLLYTPLITISIHALREESDRAEYRRYCAEQISIHALREESDRLF